MGRKKDKPITEAKNVAAAAKLLKQRITKDGVLPIADVVEASIVAMFFCQKLGKVTDDQIREKIEAIGGTINEHLLLQSIEALQARGLISYARGQLDDGTSVKMWKPRQIVWAAAPEVAHLEKLLPLLVSTPEAQQLIEAFNEGEKKGEGESKATSRLGYDEYTIVEADFVTMTHLLGSQPKSPALDRLVKKSPFNGIDADLYFWRDSADGALVIGADAARGWLRTGLRTEGYADAVASYIAVDEIKLVPKQKMIQAAFPVVDARQGGKGITSYEATLPGEHVTVRFRIPTKGFMTAEQFQAFLAGYAPNPVRGISPARGGRFGAMALVGFRVIGPTRSAKNFVSSVMDRIPEEARPFYEEMLAKLEKEDMPLRKGCTKV